MAVPAGAYMRGELNDDRERCWLAAYTRSHHEQQVARQLQQKELEYFLPSYERRVRWSDRIKRMPTPLFPGYVFVNVSRVEQVAVLQTTGVINFVSCAGKAVPLPPEEISRLRTCSLQARSVEPHPYLKIGHRVRVKHGPFAGWEGTLVEKQNSRRLVITIEQIMKAVAINIDGADIETIN